MQMRYDEERGIYRDCKWCQGQGCNACPGEADKEYKRQFPNGPVPILTIKTDGSDLNKAMGILNQLFGQQALTQVRTEAGELAKKSMDDPLFKSLIAQTINPGSSPEIMDALEEHFYQKVLVKKITAIQQELL